MRAGRPRHLGLRAWAMLGIGALLLTACGTEYSQSALDPRGPVARAEDDLWDIVFPISIAVFVLVQGLILVAVFKFRAKGNETEPPKQVHGNTRLEIMWTVIPALILVGIGVPTVRTIFDLSGKPDGSLEVRVIGKQYWWEYEYLGDEGQGVVTANELHIPTGRPVYILLDGIAGDDAGSANDPDVIHSFWVPQLGGKQDYVPGHTNNLFLEADEPGTYPGQCAEFCGLSHANMRLTVIAHTPEDFQAWLDGQAAPAEDPTDALAARGREIFGATAEGAAACVACHAIEGHPENADIRIAPDLTHFSTRQAFAGYVLENSDENLAAWLRNPQAVKPGAQMPNLQLDDEQVQALVAYLRTLD